ncbi:S-Ena type endospore appendage [Alicyclobacillus fodiniaquatilis]|jgi:hypothetical protein|uniref:S-Ena type endospore appendage n=1 Tax=Alicyclobacillus fodiniaquatilis TaxID=1661150 RepID=A0ABW4JBZ7_9BACL
MPGGDTLCCQIKVIPNHIDTQWVANHAVVVPYLADLPAAITGYVLNHSSSKGPVTIHFLRGGSAGAPLPFAFTVEAGAYQSFTVIGVDAIRIATEADFASGELNILVNFSPF